MQIIVRSKPIVRFSVAFAASSAVVLTILLVIPTSIGLSFREVLDHIALILGCYCFGVLLVSIWREWICLSG